MNEYLIANLTSSEELVRREAIKTLGEADISEIEPIIPELFQILREFDVEMVLLQVATNLSRTFQSNNSLIDSYIDDLKAVIDLYTSKDLTDEKLLGSVVIHLIQLVQPKLKAGGEFLKEWLDVLFKLTLTNGSVKHIASAPIIGVAMQQPILLKDHVGQIFETIDNGFSSLASSLINLYSYNPEEFINRIDNLINKYQTDLAYQSIYLMILTEIAKKNPELLVSRVSVFQTGLSNPSLATSVIMLYTELASSDAGALYPLMPQIVQATTYNPNLMYQIPNILSLIGRTSDERAREVLTHLFSFLNTANDTMKAMILSEIRNLGEMNRELLDSYIDLIRNYENSPQESIRDQAKLIVDYYEGKDVRSLANAIEEQNKKIANAATSMDELMKYVDDNIETLKKFIANIAKKIPTPREFSTEGRIRKTLILHFVCDKETDRCLFPKDRDFTTETKDWNKWLKIAFSGIKIGKAILTPASAGGAGKAVKEAYDAYKSNNDREFLAYISQPFLTSEEQDNLINQLRDAKFFNVFSYDAQTAGWLCTMCNL